ncbi:MAG: gfo/Idh/MocA family oxidoreductase [Puniceicoccaceae bacterium]|nr:MAG: gfo/Idh/MocA family oxidoreductase [Puniceicoccaceae bacterium]
MSDTLNFGFIGAGKISGYSASSVNKHPHARVAAAHDLSPERLRELCEGNNIPTAYATAEELLADKSIDAVYIAVPNKFHAPLSIQALEAGKHVILDKPFALNLKEAEQVAAAAKKSGKIFTLGMNQRFAPDSQKVRSLVADGVLGEVYHAKAYWQRREGIPRLGTWFGNKELAGAGCLYDIGVHVLDLCLYVLNNFEPVSVYGATYTKFGNRGLGEGGWGLSERSNIEFNVDDFATALIKFKNGCTVALDTTWACHMKDGNRNGVELFGTEAGATTHPAQIFRRNPVRESYEVIEDIRAKVAFPHGDRFSNFINHLRGEEDLCVSIEQALAVQKILDAIAESSATGKEVVIG